MSYEHYDTNCGEGMYRDTPEEKEIERLKKQRDALSTAVQVAQNVSDKYERILQLLVAAGHVTEEKVEQAKELIGL